MFCPTCGSLLKPKQLKEKRILACSCGYTSSGSASGAAISEKGRGSQGVEVVEEVESKPLVDATCGKCGHTKAYYWSIQTRASDEPETQFFKCEKCRHTWREYK
jgi:transcription factor S